MTLAMVVNVGIHLKYQIIAAHLTVTVTRMPTRNQLHRMNSKAKYPTRQNASFHFCLKLERTLSKYWIVMPILNIVGASNFTE
jgi:hypothetical protein